MTRYLIALLGLATLATAARAQTVDPARLDSIIRKTVADKHIVGLSVGVMQNGKVILDKGYGVRDLASGAPVTAQTMFAVGSVTKQFTCTALMMLVEAHRAALTDRVATWYPNLTRARDISLIDLGGHLSGYHDYYPLDFVDREMSKPATADAIISEYATAPLDFEPRSRYSYSNTGFLILGRIVEKASGQPFGGFLQQRIFTPLDLAHTAYEPRRDSRDGREMASGYTSFGLSDPIAAEPEAPSWAGMAGAIWSTPADLLAWDRSLVDHTLISKQSFDVLTTPQRLSDGRSSGYGCGEAINDRGGMVILSHGGAVSGFVAQNTVIPATRSAVVMLSNTDFSPIGQLNSQLVQMLVPRNADVPAVAGRTALEAARKFLLEIENGSVDRASLGEDFSAFLTADRVAAGRKALSAMGPISNIAIAGVGERGGMEVATVTFTVGSTAARGLMYRTPDGKVQEFLFSRN
ncbi:MAG TPA: serine hydrolase domain-containing protein [Gemmatimonadaceae bacterium]|jgi:CubicO group peptidase (beta-lactamase class C family)|nr:serine hydrolase domain-containing protein [Gemmatimonadaceae bacterium]